jgi:hypothetical protein
MLMTITSTGHDYSTMPTRDIEYDQSNLVHTPFLYHNWAQLSLGQPTIDGSILAQNRQYRDQNVKSRADFQMNPFQLIFPTKPYEISHQWTNHFQTEGDYGNSIVTPTANNYHTGIARTKHREVHSPIEKARNSKCTWRLINKWTQRTMISAPS